MNDELEIINEQPVESALLMPLVAGEFDVQVATAKKFPRKITQSFDNAKAIATMSEDTSKTCGYMVPRSGKNISGPSVHLARILAQSWGNLRISQQVVGEEDRFVLCEAVAWDLETNLAIKTQVRKRITNKDGKRFNDDMIGVTGNAGMAIAFRNCVFAVIPKTVVEGVYQATRRKITGDLTTEDKIVAKRKELLMIYEKNYGISEQQMLKFFKINQATQIKQDQIVELIDLLQAFKDGDTTPAQVFADADTDAKIVNIGETMKERKAKSEAPAQLKQPEVTPPVPAATTGTVPPPANNAPEPGASGQPKLM